MPWDQKHEWVGCPHTSDFQRGAQNDRKKRLQVNAAYDIARNQTQIKNVKIRILIYSQCSNRENRSRIGSAKPKEKNERFAKVFRRKRKLFNLYKQQKCNLFNDRCKIIIIIKLSRKKYRNINKIIYWKYEK